MLLTAALPDCALRSLSPGFTRLTGFDDALLAAALAGETLAGTGGAPLAPLAAWLREVALTAPAAPVTAQFDLVDAGGRPLALEVVALVTVDAAGVAPLLLARLRDLSAARALVQDQRRFASMLNHEFRTPLATIDGAVQRLEAFGHQVDEPTRQRYRKIGAAVDRLIGMLDEYLSPDRMAALGSSRQPNTISVGELIEGAQAQLRQAGREVVLDIEEQQLRLRGEPQGLRLALKVLVDNALAYSPPDTPVTLGARRQGGGIEIAVHNEGAAVDAADAARIFDKGYRGANAAAVAGSGLGLYIARSIVDVHGGVLGLAPPAARGGVEFRMWMPVLVA